MGLTLMVGYLADLKRNDHEGYDMAGKGFKALNECLARAGLNPHDEPVNLAPEEVKSYEMSGYNGLHFLRRLAIYVASARPLFEPSRELTDSYDAEFKEYVNSFVIDSNKNPYQNLLMHGDSEGFYIPQDFDRIIDPHELFDLVGGPIGSAPRLLAECQALATHLDLPMTMDPDDAEIWDALDSPGNGTEKWQRYGNEAFSCIRLIRACEHSIKTGSAVVFC